MNTTIYNLTMGVLGALGAIVLLLNLRRLHLRTRLRNAVRRVLGIESFEELTISELRGYRADVDRWTRDVRQDSRELRDEMLRRNTALTADRTRNNRVKREVEELGILLRQYTDALGPMWTTAQGHTMPLRLLSTSHLRNISEGGFGGWDVRQFIERELERRSIDAQWRAHEAEGKKPPTKDDLRTGRGQIDPRIPASYTPQVAMRVAEMLPQWAQSIIAELLRPEGRVLNRAEWSRVRNVLPVWAVQLIIDLEQTR